MKGWTKAAIVGLAFTLMACGGGGGGTKGSAPPEAAAPSAEDLKACADLQAAHGDSFSAAMARFPALTALTVADDGLRRRALKIMALDKPAGEGPEFQAYLAD